MSLAGLAYVVETGLALDRTGTTGVSRQQVIPGSAFVADSITGTGRTASKRRTDGTSPRVVVVSIHTLDALGLRAGIAIGLSSVTEQAGSGTKIVACLTGETGRSTGTGLTPHCSTHHTIVGSESSIKVIPRVATRTQTGRGALRTIFIAFGTSGTSQVIPHSTTETASSRITSTAC